MFSKFSWSAISPSRASTVGGQSAPKPRGQRQRARPVSRPAWQQPARLRSQPWMQRNETRARSLVWASRLRLRDVRATPGLRSLRESCRRFPRACESAAAAERGGACRPLREVRGGRELSPPRSSVRAGYGTRTYEIWSAGGRVCSPRASGAGARSGRGWGGRVSGRAVLADAVSGAWRAFERASALDARVDPSVPVLLFGDADAYFGSPLRVVTVGLNPSSREFPASDPFERFPLADGISALATWTATWMRYRLISAPARTRGGSGTSSRCWRAWAPGIGRGGRRRRSTPTSARRSPPIRP